MAELIPPWVRAWYVLNVIVAPYEWLFVMLRPRTLASGDLAYLFGPFNFYAKYDRLFGDHTNNTTFYIYVIFTLNFVLGAFLFLILTVDPLARQRPSTAVLALVRAASMATTIAVYVMCSSDYLVSFQRTITVLNSAIILIPMCVIFSVSKRLCDAYPTQTKRD